MSARGEFGAEGYQAARLTARPRLHATPPDGPAGEHRGIEAAGWSGVLFVPSSYRPERPAPLMLSFHGASRKGDRMVERWRDTVEAARVIMLAPDSIGPTWDCLAFGGFGRDVERIDHALADVFARYNVHRAPLLIEGFSDGASYALSLGIANGDLFTHVLANSPGLCWPPSINGTPRFLFTHGTEDNVLPIDRTSRLIAPQLDMAGYDVTFEEFDGAHVLTPETMRRSLEWAGVSVP